MILNWINVHHVKITGFVRSATSYRHVRGALQYVCVTQPDIAYTVDKVSQYMQNPYETH